MTCPQKFFNYILSTWHFYDMSSKCRQRHVLTTGHFDDMSSKCLWRHDVDMSFMSGRLKSSKCLWRHVVWPVRTTFFLPNVGPTFSTCLRYVGACRDDMSFGGSRQHDATPTFPTKSSPYFQFKDGFNEGDIVRNFVVWGVRQWWVVLPCPPEHDLIPFATLDRPPSESSHRW